MKSHRSPDHARPRTKIIIYFPGNAFFFVVGRIGEWLTFSWAKLILQEVGARSSLQNPFHILDKLIRGNEESTTYLESTKI